LNKQTSIDLTLELSFFNLYNRLRNPLSELKSYYEADTAARGSAKFLEEPTSSVWVVYGSQAFVARCAAKYWGVMAVNDVENLLLAGRHPSETSGTNGSFHALAVLSGE
jgi:hypothetical protein